MLRKRTLSTAHRTRILISSMILGIFVWFVSGVSAQNATIQIPDISAQCGDTITVPVQVGVKDFIGYTGIQFSLTWNHDALDYIGLTGQYGPLDLKNSNFKLPPAFPNKDTLTFVWFSVTPLDIEPNTGLFSIKYVVKGAGPINSLINIINKPTPIFIYGEVGGNPFTLIPNVNTDPGSFKINDQNIPILVCPDDVTVVAPAGSGKAIANNIYPKQASDNCHVAFLGYSFSGSTTGFGQGDPSGTVFNAGSTLVNYTINDPSNNFNYCQFEVFVVDTASSILEVKLQNIQTDCSKDKVLVNVTADNFNDIAGLTFGINWDENIFQLDTIINLNTTLSLVPLGKVNSSFGPTPKDNDTLTFFMPVNPGGITLPTGDTLYTLVFNKIGAATCSKINFISTPTVPIKAFAAGTPPFEVPIDTANSQICFNDTIPPTIVCPADTLVKVNQGQFSAIVGGLTPTTGDNCGIKELYYTLSGSTSGSGTGDVSNFTFFYGQTEVNYTVQDFSGNTASCNYKIVVADSVLRLLPTSTIAICDSGKVAINVTASNFKDILSLQCAMAWNPSILSFDTVGNFDPNLQLNFGSNFGPANITDTLNFAWIADTNGLSLPDGTTLFTVYFDINANAGSQTKFEFVSSSTTPIEAYTTKGQIGVLAFDALINIFDFMPPTLECPSNINIKIPQGTTFITINDIAPINVSDNCGIKSVKYETTGSTTVNGADDASGNDFNLGSTTVTYIVEDFGGNTETCSFVINVVPDTFLLYLDTINAQCTNGVVTVDVKVKNFNNITSLQFGMTWDKLLLALDTITNLNPALSLIGQGLPGTNFGPPVMTDSLTFAWYNNSGVTLPDGSVLFTLTLTPKQIKILNTFVNFINYPTTPIEVSATNGGIPFLIPYKIINGVVNIVDSIPPVLTCPPNITVFTDLGKCSATAVWSTVTAVDNCSALVNLTSNYDPGAEFKLGIDTVIYTGTDEFGNVGTCSFEIKVIDGEKPVINCPGNQTYDNDPGECGSTIALPQTIDATDNCSSTLTYKVNQPDIKFYSVGGHNILYTVTDEAGNSATCNFILIIKDLELPTIVDCPIDTVVEPAVNINNMCFAEVSWSEPLVDDNCPNTQVKSSVTSGSLFPAGTTIVQYIVNDASGNTATCSFSVTVQSFASGFNNCPSDIVVPVQQDTCGAFVSWVPPFFVDACGDTLNVYSNYSPGTFFPPGTTQVVYITAANSIVLDTCYFNVTVEDEDPQVINCPGDIIISSLPDTCGNFVDWIKPFVLNSCGDSLTLTSNYTPGAFLPVGVYSVVYTAPNLPGCAFNITVTDAIKPEHGLCPPNQMIEVPDTICGAIVTWSEPEFTDNCDNDLFIISSHNSGDYFPTGKTIVTYIAIDDFGNVDTCSFELFIRETIKPVLFNCPSDVTLESLPNACGNFHNWIVPTATDNCDTNVVITSNFSPGEFFPVGTTVVIYTATDNSGNVTTCSFTITITETQNPILICPQDIVIDGFGNIVTDPSDFIADVVPDTCNNLVLFFNQFIGNDNCAPAGIVAQQIAPDSPKNGEAFPADTYNMVFGVTDPSGLSATCAFNITVLPYQYNIDIDTLVACLNEAILLTSPTVPGATEYIWTGPDSLSTKGQSVEIFIDDLNKEGYYKVLVVLGNCQGKTYTDSVYVSIDPAPDAIDDLISVGNSDSLYNVAFLNNDLATAGIFLEMGSVSSGSYSLNNDNTLNYFPDKNFFGAATIGYKICLVDCPLACDSATIRIDVIDDKICIVPTLISPNGDDINDYLYIKCIDTGKYNDNRLVIYNEWGDQVFEAAPYQNNWKGTLEKVDGKNLPDGTYYFVFFESREDKNPKYGFITILR
ncbi:MAG TPA: HYR domain-containing protein [Saprospiraceae bacterium]|nr:HYR domain-containing protein [Saprospiraceae bacterium]